MSLFTIVGRVVLSIFADHSAHWFRFCGQTYQCLEAPFYSGVSNFCDYLCALYINVKIEWPVQYTTERSHSREEGSGFYVLMVRAVTSNYSQLQSFITAAAPTQSELLGMEWSRSTDLCYNSFRCFMTSGRFKWMYIRFPGDFLQVFSARVEFYQP